MLKVRNFWWLALWCGAQIASADVIRLKDSDAALTGKILSEKRDSVAVDVGYTVLVVPRANIASISKIEGKNWRHGDIEDMLKTVAFLRGIYAKAIGP